MKKQILKTLENYLKIDKCFITEDEQIKLEKQIEYLKEEIRKEEVSEYVKQLKRFIEHMHTSYNVLMGDAGTDETCTVFYNSEFEITWRGKTVRIHNGAEVFNEIEDIINTELDNI